jgi:hypothetical protein
VRDLATLSADDFEQAGHEPFVIVGRHENGESDVVLRLDEVRRIDRPGEGRQPFSLFFVGPPAPLLGQAIYRLDNAVLGPLEIFIVPIAASADSTQYEAVFT